MKKSYSFIAVFITVFLFSKADAQTYHNLSSGPFTQNWSNTGLITTNDIWTGVPGIIGYLGQEITTATGTDPQTLLTISAVANDIDVIANQTTPNTLISGGVAEFEITNSTIALQGSGTADAPHIIIYLNTTGTNNIRVQYKLRDIDGSSDNAIQPVALQYRIGGTGNFTNIPAAFIADASSGPNLATLETAVDIILPAACDNQAQVELRIITTNAVGNDEWIGIDDINVSASGGPPASTLSVASGTNAAESSTAGTFTLNFNPATTTSIDVNFAFTGSAGFGTDYTISFSTGTINSTTSTGTLTVPSGTTSVTVTITPIDDAIFESAETITLTLSSPTGGYSLGTATASISLADNDSPPTVTVTAGTAAAEPTTNGTFNITLSNAAPAGGITVGYSLSGSATTGTDYTDPLNGNVTIAEGMTSAVVTINVTDDAIAEPTETIIITLNSITSPYTIITPGATINLSDNDIAPLTPISLTGATYSQDYNTLSNTGSSSFLPMGWTFTESGSTANTTYSAGTGSSTSGDTYSFGAAGDIERAFGTLQTGNLIPTIGALFTNNAGNTITSLTISYTGEQWRLGSNTTGRLPDRLDFQYSLSATNLTNGTWIDVDALDFNSPVLAGTNGALDGNAVANRTAISSTINGLNIPAGATFLIRWTDFNITGSDDGLSVDDFSVSYTVFADVTPPTVTLLSPANGAINHASNQPLQISFNEPILKGTGNIIINNITDGTSQNIDVATTAVTVNSNSATITASLLGGKQYSVIIPSGVFTDLSGNPFSGITAANWVFTVVIPDVTAPTLVSITPPNGAIDIPTTVTLSGTFSENIIKGTGYIEIKRLSDGSRFDTINVGNPALIINGNQVSYNVTGLKNSTAYYVEAQAGTFTDLAGNPFAGFSGPSTWTFTTAAITFYNFNFDACTPFNSAGSGWTQFSVAGDSVWNCSPFGFNNTNGVQINGFVNPSGPAENEDWFISPVLDITSFNIPILSFRERTRFAGPGLQILVSTNYTGSGAPGAATWMILNSNLPDANSDVWTLVDNINLSAYKTATTYIAFKYISSPTAGAARTTIDDIDIRNANAAPAPVVIKSPNLINFDFVTNGNISVSRSFQFTGFNITGDVTITAPASFQLSKDNVAFSNSITYTLAELDGAKTAYVRFAPTAANTTISGKLSFTSAGLGSTQIEVAGNSYPETNTLDVVNWNIEWFGGTPGPSDDNLQQANVKRVLDSLDADVYAFSEIVDINRFANMVAGLNGYAYTVSDYGSSAPNPGSGNYVSAQKLAFVYRTSVVTNVSARGLLQSSATANANWSTGRVPYLMQADIVKEGATARYNFILLHGKANTGTTAEQLDSYNRRKAGAKELKDTLDAYFSTAKIIVLGDYNDDLDSTIAPGVSPRITSYDDIVKDSTDSDSYRSISLPLSLAGLRSTASNPDVVDHVVISNEVFPDYIPGTARLVTEVESWITNYSITTSDHYPVMSRYLFPADVTAPTLVNTDPANNAVGVPKNVTLKMNFSENVQAGTGNILLKKTSDNSVVSTINISSVNITNAQVSFVVSGLSYSTSYYIEVPNTVIKDLAGNGFAGFSGAAIWSFTTAAPPDIIAPTLVSTDPVNNAIGVGINPTLRITFSEAIMIGTGDILVKKIIDNSIAATINISSVAITGAQASFAVTGLQPSTQYYVEVPNTVFKDLAGNAFAGFTGSVTWKFITTSITGLPPLSPLEVELIIYPNPTSKNLIFTFRPAAGKIFYQIIDANGKIMLQTNTKNVGSHKLLETININNLPAGLYIIKIINNNRLIKEKFVKK